MYYVIETGGKQYLVQSGESVKVEKLLAETGQEISFDKILLTANDDGSDVKIGTPYLTGVVAKAIVEIQGRNKKINVVKYKCKIRYTKVHGHRQHFTKAKIS